MIHQYRQYYRHHGRDRLIAFMAPIAPIAIMAILVSSPSGIGYRRARGSRPPTRRALPRCYSTREGERPRFGPPPAARLGGVGKAREEIHVVPCAQLTCLTSLTSHAACEPAVHPKALQRWALGPTNQPNVGGLVKGPVHVVPCAPLAAPASVDLMGGYRVPFIGRRSCGTVVCFSLRDSVILCIFLLPLVLGRAEEDT